LYAFLAKLSFVIGDILDLYIFAIGGVDCIYMCGFAVDLGDLCFGFMC